MDCTLFFVESLIFLFGEVNNININFQEGFFLVKSPLLAGKLLYFLIILFCVTKVTFLCVLKDLVAIRGVIIFHDIYVLLYYSHSSSSSGDWS